MDKVDVLMHISGHGESDMCEWANNNLQELAWNKCSDKMPEPGDRVLCVTKRHGLKILSLSRKSKVYRRLPPDWRGEIISGVQQSFAIAEITHWMPLPELPEGGGKLPLPLTRCVPHLASTTPKSR